MIYHTAGIEEMDSATVDRTAPIKEIVESMNELVKRNEEKRKAIMELQSRIEKLNQEKEKFMNENRALKMKLKSGGEEAEKYCSFCTKYSENQRTYSQLAARLKSLIFGSLVGGGSD